MEALLTLILAAGLVFVLAIPAYILNGFVITKLWAWFIVPFGLEPITMAPAIGLGIIIGFLAKQYVPSGDDDKWKSIVFMYLTPLLSLLTGWIVTWFI